MDYANDVFGVEFTPSDAHKYIERYRATYPQVANWQEQMRSRAYRARHARLAAEYDNMHPVMVTFERVSLRKFKERKRMRRSGHCYNWRTNYLL